MTTVLCIQIAAVSGFITVALGAFGAHGLKALLTEHNAVEIWDKAVFYQMAHTLALLGLALRPRVNTGAAVGFIVGIIIFSGSLYVLGLTNVRWMGAMTPIGGLAFLVGWGLWFWNP